MNYNDLLEILLSKNVYKKMKEYELEVFELIPELKMCEGFEQNNEWHIYDVYEHTLRVVAGVGNNIYLRLASLFHDIGKPLTYTKDSDGVGHFHNHWNKSVEIFEKYQDKFGLSKEEASLIANLIFYHDINISSMNDLDFYNMINKIGSCNIELLFSLKKADLLAQSPKFHNLLLDINNQERQIDKKLKKNTIRQVNDDNTVYFYDDSNNEIMHIDHSIDECIWYFNSDKTIKITKDMPLYSLLDNFMEQDYVFYNDCLLNYKDNNKLIWYSDCYYNPDDEWSIASVSCLNIEKKYNYFKVWCTKKLDEMLTRKNKTYGVCFSPSGNGKYSRNLNTGATLQDDFVSLVYQPLLNPSKILKKELKQK